MSDKYNFARRYSHTNDTKDGTFTRSSIFKFPEAVEYFKPVRGSNQIDIIPYNIKTKKHPLVSLGEKGWNVGSMDYVFDIWEHKFIGPKKGSYVCLQRSYGKPCPICEQAQKYWNEGKENEYRALKAKRRCYYNVLSHADDADETKLLVFDASFEWFEKELVDEAQSAGDIPVDFADPKDGKTVKFRAVPSDLKPMKKGGEPPLEYKSFTFLDRDPVDSYIEDAISFDEFVQVPTYDELAKALYGAEEDDEEEEDEPKKPAKKDEEDEAPPRRQKEKADKGGECPHGYTFGESVDEYPECAKCKVWGACDKANS